MTDIDVDKLDYLVRMRMDSPEEYKRYMEAFKGILKDFKDMLDEVS